MRVGFVFGLLLAAGVALADDPVAGVDAKVILDECERVAQRCRFTVLETSQSGGGLQATVVPAAEAVEGMAAFFAAIDVFPVRLLQDSGLNKVAFCTQVKMGGVQLGGLNYDKTMYVKLPIRLSSVYHQLYYLLDNPPVNPEWTSLNRTGFLYSGSEVQAANFARGRDARQAKAALDDEKLAKDFVQPYAMSSELEDRACTFEAMMANPAAFAAAAKESTVLKKKGDFIRRRVARVTPTMNKAFWDSIDDTTEESRLEDFCKRAVQNNELRQKMKPPVIGGYKKVKAPAGK